MLYDVILPESSTFFYYYLMTYDCCCDYVMWLVTVWQWCHAKTLTLVPKIEDKRKIKVK